MSVHRYARPALRADLIRGTVGLALCLAPILFLTLHWVVLAVFAVSAALFGFFVARSLLRCYTVICLDDVGIVARGPLGCAIAWSQLQRLRLRFFSTRRDRANGWMQMTLQGPGTTLALESTLDGFGEIAERACRAALANGVALSPTTVANLDALGIDAAPAEPAAAPLPRRDWIAAVRAEREAGKSSGIGEPGR